MTDRESRAAAGALPTAAGNAESLPGGAPGGAGRNVLLAVALVTVALSVMTVWSVPRPTGDLYVGLAAGRDIMAGKMGKVDDWSFATEGRVWINQNWGTNLLYWVSNELGGETGLLILKMLMLMTGAFFLVLACRRRDADWPVALIVSAGVIAAGRSFIDLRPNLTTLMFVPVMLHLLYRTAEKPHRIWLTMVAFGVIWANLHGGFTLGLLAMFFWATCVVFLPMLGRERLAAWVPGVAIAASAAASLWYIVDANSGAAVTGTVIPPKAIWAVVGFATSLAIWYGIRRRVAPAGRAGTGGGRGPVADRIKEHLRSKWPYLAAAFGAVVLAGVVTPFGIHNALRDFRKLSMPFWEMWNLTHPLVVTFGQDSEVWRSVIEWHNLFSTLPNELPNTFGTSWEFFGIVGLFCALAPLSVAVKIHDKKLLDVEDAVLLAVIIGLCVVIVAQAAPIHGAFGQIIDKYEFERGVPAEGMYGIRLQYYGWLTVLIVYPLIGLFTVGVSIAAISDWMVRRQMAPWSAERIGIVVFDVCMAAGGIKMAFGARRFMPLSLMLLAPLLARRMQWLAGWLGEMLAGWLDETAAGREKPGRTKAGHAAAKPPLTPAQGLLWHLPTVIIGLSVLAVIGIQAAANYNHYRTDSPLVRYRSVLKNMIVYQEFCPYAKDFIRDNDLSGRCFNEWRWEGYLQWYCPKLTMLIGGRAQQAYAIETYKLQRDLLGGLVPLSRLQDMGVRWIIVPWKGEAYNSLINRAMYGQGAAWVPVFYDGENIILANSRLPECQEVIRRCRAGQLRYPNKAYAHLSRGMCLSSAAINLPVQAVADIKKAQQLEPISMSYVMLSDLYNRAALPSAGEINYLEGETRRLEKMDYHCLDGFEILRCRLYALSVLGQYYRRTGQLSQVSRVAAEVNAINELMGRVAEEWD